MAINGDCSTLLTVFNVTTCTSMLVYQPHIILKYVIELYVGRGKSIISKVGELFSSPGPQFVPGPPFISWAHVAILGSQIINDRLNVLSMFSFPIL